MSCCKRCEALERAAGPVRRERSRVGQRVGAMPPRYGIGLADGPAHGAAAQPACEGHGHGHDHAHAPEPPAATAPGRALDPATRAYFERGMGHDFGRVRVHDDAAAAASAEAMGALAYTVGGEISFAAGRYHPEEAAGARLLAHELAHVVQQGAAAPAGGAMPPARPAAVQAWLAAGASGEAFEREADQVAAAVVAGAAAVPTLRTEAGVQMQPAPSLLSDEPLLRPPSIPPPLVWPGSIRESWVIPLPSAPAELEVPPPPVPFWRRQAPAARTLTLDPVLRFTPVMIVRVPRCVPDRPLTWADFPGNSPPGGFGAITRMVTPQIVVDGNPMFQVRLRENPASAVVPKHRNPNNRRTNGCAPLVARCQRDMRAQPNGTWSTSRPNPDTCPASIISIDTATTVSECETVIGANCDSAAAAESARLLAHEQLHFDIACTLVGRANDALIAGTHTPAQLETWLRTNLQPLQNRYDSPSQSDHGCDAGGQATWAGLVAGGLTSVALP